MKGRERYPINDARDAKAMVGYCIPEEDIGRVLKFGYAFIDEIYGHCPGLL